MKEDVQDIIKHRDKLIKELKRVKEERNEAVTNAIQLRNKINIFYQPEVTKLHKRVEFLLKAGTNLMEYNKELQSEMVSMKEKIRNYLTEKLK